MRARAGLSLVEVLIAMVILAIGLAPIALLFTTTGREGENDRMELEATALASELLEQVRSMAEGRLGVPEMKRLPPDLSVPEEDKWMDVEARLAAEGVGFPLYRGCQFPEESSRMYIEPTHAGFKRWLQVLPAPLLKGLNRASSPHLLEIRVRVDYGVEPARRQIVLDTLVSHEDVAVH